MAHPVEYVVFAILMATNLGLGLYFAIRTKNSIVTLDEVFLGSRTLKTLPLAMSAFASMMSSGMIIVMPAYYYKHGFHMGYMFLVLVILIPVTTRIIIPVLYRLKVTSVFEYVRMRFGTKTSLATCLLYFFLMQTTGAVSIFASSVAISAVSQLAAGQ
ncbi:putative sodium-dependent multivitamin transporter [Ixodes scapularis]|uniref:putative sodium-dependent multivitamin transporter n=1 Tax=Ixodes scapularis TaxID=6945 RepID=UPI001C383765|nr:putative sodium-dependent multivitamin transporter [Ixodes scapularis]